MLEVLCLERRDPVGAWLLAQAILRTQDDADELELVRDRLQPPGPRRHNVLAVLASLLVVPFVVFGVVAIVVGTVLGLIVGFSLGVFLTVRTLDLLAWLTGALNSRQRCQCLLESRIGGPAAGIYAQAHLRSFTVAAGALPALPAGSALRSCPRTGILWLAVGVPGELPVVLLRGAAPTAPSAVEAPGMYL